MNKFVLNDIREFCLCHLERPTIGEKCEYIPIYYRVFVWKVLKCNSLLHLVDLEFDKYMEELQTRKISAERFYEIWHLTKPIYNKLIEYSSVNFVPSLLYSTLTSNGEVKEEIKKILLKAGAHSWVCYITPITEKFWVEGDMTFDEFYHNCSLLFTSEINVPKEWWDFHQKKRPEIRDEWLGINNFSLKIFIIHYYEYFIFI